MNCYGVNYEGGKILAHARKQKGCVGFTNLQIAMDCPFGEDIADENVRSRGRSETQFKGYDEAQLIEQLSLAFKNIASKFKRTQIVCQIARGRSASSFKDEVIEVARLKANLSEFIYFYGYRTTDYFTAPQNVDFFFVNIGMYGRLSENTVGALCVPIKTNNIWFKDEKLVCDETHLESDDYFYQSQFLAPIHLLGIEDSMPFVTPQHYQKEDFLELISLIEKKK